MKALGRSFLVLNFFFVFLSLLLAITFKFQFLDSKFWVRTFEKYRVYDGIQQAVEGTVVQQIVKQGGTPKQGKALAAFLQKNTLKDFLEKNLVNLDSFLNAKDKTLKLYVPVSSLPPGFLPKNLAIKNNEIDIQTVSPNIKVGQLASTGTLATISLGIAIFFVLLSLWGLYKSNDPGTKLIFPGGTIIAASVVVLILIAVLNAFSVNMTKELVKEGSEPVQILLGTITRPIVLEVGKLWMVVCGVTIALGIGALFIKKPV